MFYSPEDHDPSKVKAVPRLKNDLAALSILVSGDVSYRVPARF